MGTRFGAVSPAQTYATKVRWLVGCLISVILVLFIAIVFISGGSDTPDPGVADVVVDPVEPVAAMAGNIDVLVAATRIEEGARLERFMFNVVPMEEDKAPIAIVRAPDLEAVVGKYAKRMISANMPLIFDDISEKRPFR